MTEMITISDTPVYVSKPEGDIKGGLIVIHEIWGLNDHTKDVADRYAAEGYLVYAPDLLSHTDKSLDFCMFRFNSSALTFKYRCKVVVIYLILLS